MASDSTKINLKLLVDTSSNRVLFAEAGKDFVDFLFGLLELPLGSILGQLAKQGMMKTCSIGKVYETVKNLDPNSFQLNETKSSLLNPPNHPSSKAEKIPMLQKFGRCTITCSSPPATTPAFSSSPLVFGNSFAKPSSSLFERVGTSAVNPQQVMGYVKEMISYMVMVHQKKKKNMVMDDLTVKPISIITILNTFRVRDVGCLQEKTVELDFKMALKLVKASFESTTVLTDVFLTDGVDPQNIIKPLRSTSFAFN